MFDAALTPQQLIVINALSEGANMTGAAAQAGLHRNTIANWRRDSLFFREALADAQYDRALHFRDKAEERLDQAFATVDAILDDPKASPATRLKAALFIIEKATTPPAPRKQVPFDISEVHMHKVPNPAQNAQSQPTPSEPAEPAEPAEENPPAVHNHAQSAHLPHRRDTPKVGRNDACPCGSGQKHKRCCLNKPQPKAA